MSLAKRTRRGDTIIEIMFAIAVFALVAVISVSVMNLGTATAENALELVTARNELNAQAEALRFVHSSYISEKTLPLRSDLTTEQLLNEKYQQYADLWNTIVSNAVTPDEAKAAGFFDLADTTNNSDTITATGCARMYTPLSTGGTLLGKVNAFVLNTRDLSGWDASGQFNLASAYVSAKDNPGVFREAELNARIIFTNDTSAGGDNSSTQIQEGDILNHVIYNRIKWVEGIWVVAVSDGSGQPADSQYYDFYIETCWYGPNTTSPTAIDTVIRLYNPENV